MILTAATKDEDRQGHQAKQQPRAHKAVPASLVIPAPINAGPDEGAHNQCIDDDNKPADCTRASAQATINQASYAYWQTAASIAGVVVGALTLAAAIWAGRWAKAAAMHTETGAVEAKRSATAAETANRPFVFVESLQHNGRDWRIAGEHFEWHFRIANHGNGPAIITSLIAEVVLSDIIPLKERDFREDSRHGSAPVFRDKWRGQELCSTGLVLSAGSVTKNFTAHAGRVLNRRDDVPPDIKSRMDLLYTLTAGNVTSLWLLGTCFYQDAFGAPRETGFCRRVNFPRADSSTEEGGTEYNYRT